MHLYGDQGYLTHYLDSLRKAGVRETA